MALAVPYLVFNALMRTEVATGTLSTLPLAAPAPLGVVTLLCLGVVAVTSYLLAETDGADAEAVAGLVVSTLMSVIALPTALAFLIWRPGFRHFPDGRFGLSYSKNHKPSIRRAG